VPDESVDAVIASLTVPDPDRALAKVRRVLRRDGRFWCVEQVAAQGELSRECAAAPQPPVAVVLRGAATRSATSSGGYGRPVCRRRDHAVHAARGLPADLVEIAAVVVM
jgi:hypothetical protein